MLVYGKDCFEGGRVCDRPVSLVDLAPTFLHAAGLPFDDHPLEGEALQDVVAGRSDRDYVFAQISAHGLPILDPDADFEARARRPGYLHAYFSQYMAAGAKAKYIYSAPDHVELFFDKVADPLETRNGAGNPFYKEAKHSAKKTLLDHLKALGETGGLNESGEDFERFPQQPLSRDPDAGLLIQDNYVPWVSDAIPRYTNGEA